MGYGTYLYVIMWQGFDLTPCLDNASLRTYEIPRRYFLLECKKFGRD